MSGDADYRRGYRTARERAYAEACKRATSIERAGGGHMVIVSVEDAEGFYRVQSIEVSK